jgi:hypothetical protein
MGRLVKLHKSFVENPNQMVCFHQMHCNTERYSRKRHKPGVGQRRREKFGRPRHRQDPVECIGALYCEFRTSQEFKIQIRIQYVPAS